MVEIGQIRGDRGLVCDKSSRLFLRARMVEVFASPKGGPISECAQGGFVDPLDRTFCVCICL